MKLLTVVGARPQFVKASALSRAIRSRPAITEVVVHTGQHYDTNMSEVFFGELELAEPEHNLGIGALSHGQMTGRMIEQIEKVLVAEEPDCVVVYGDTNSTLAGAIAAAKLKIPVAHVEAGLRSYNLSMPEEINRVLTDHCADLLFAPTQGACTTLAGEGIPPDKVHLVGDIMYDVALHYASRADARSSVVSDLDLESGHYVLATIHRAENTDDRTRLAAIFAELRKIAERLPVVMPIHPRTRAQLRGLTNATDGLTIAPPVGYLDMVALEKHAGFVVTDSGGVQKEAFFHRVPCLTVRSETEWTELVEGGWNRLVEPSDLHETFMRLLDSPPLDWGAAGIYGSGDAAAKIVTILAERNR